MMGVDVDVEDPGELRSEDADCESRVVEDAEAGSLSGEGVMEAARKVDGDAVLLQHFLCGLDAAACHGAGCVEDARKYGGIVAPQAVGQVELLLSHSLDVLQGVDEAEILLACRIRPQKLRLLIQKPQLLDQLVGEAQPYRVQRVLWSEVVVQELVAII